MIKNKTLVFLVLLLETKTIYMRNLFIIIVAIMLMHNSYAQKNNSAASKPLKFSAGLEAALPIGNFATRATYGIGGTVQVDYNVAKKLDLTFNTGYINFTGNTQKIAGLGSYKFPTQNFIPLIAGIKYYFSENVFGAAQLGATVVSFKGGGSSTDFTLSPGVGYKFSNKIDALIKYTGYTGGGYGLSNTIGLRLGYTF